MFRDTIRPPTTEYDALTGWDALDRPALSVINGSAANRTQPSGIPPVAAPKAKEPADDELVEEEPEPKKWPFGTSVRTMQTGDHWEVPEMHRKYGITAMYKGADKGRETWVLPGGKHVDSKNGKLAAAKLEVEKFANTEEFKQKQTERNDAQEETNKTLFEQVGAAHQLAAGAQELAAGAQAGVNSVKQDVGALTTRVDQTDATLSSVQEDVSDLKAAFGAFVTLWMAFMAATVQIFMGIGEAIAEAADERADLEERFEQSVDELKEGVDSLEARMVRGLDKRRVETNTFMQTTCDANNDIRSHLEASIGSVTEKIEALERAAAEKEQELQARKAQEDAKHEETKQVLTRLREKGILTQTQLDKLVETHNENVDDQTAQALNANRNHSKLLLRLKSQTERLAKVENRTTAVEAKTALSALFK